MKRYFFLFSILLFSISSFAQDHRFHLLLVGGANASQVNGDKLAGFDKFGLNVGAGVKRSISSKSSFQIEFLYSEKGSKDVASTNNPIPDTLFQFNYIDIPIVYAYNIYPKLNLELGIYNSVRLKSIYSDFINDYDRTSVIRSTDHGVTGGVNYQIIDDLSVNIRVSQSIFDINASIERYFNLATSFSIRYSL